MEKKWIVALVVLVLVFIGWRFYDSDSAIDNSDIDYYCDSIDDCDYIGEGCSYCKCGAPRAVNKDFIESCDFEPEDCDSGCDIRAMSMPAPQCIDNRCV